MKTMKTISTKQRLAGLKIRCDYGGPGSRRHKNELSENEWETDTESRRRGVIKEIATKKKNIDSLLDNCSYDKVDNDFNNILDSMTDYTNSVITASKNSDIQETDQSYELTQASIRLSELENNIKNKPELQTAYLDSGLDDLHDEITRKMNSYYDMFD